MAETETRKLRLWHGRIETEVEIAGSGPPLVFLHGPWGLRGDRDFRDRLAQSHTVYAPKHPGTSRGDPDAARLLDGMLDLIVYHDELFDHLALAAPVVIGHSYGGMLACEIAAALPARVSKLVLIDPIGLWRDDLPVRNWMILSDEERRRALFADPAGEAVQRFVGLRLEGAERADDLVAFIWSQACTGKFVWPIPDKGLKNRIHRVAAPTLIVWGQADGVIAAAYAEEFKQRIATARVEMIDGAGHLPHVEQPETTARLVSEFLRR
jgi:pimeloyl-ACP methyl ester carboxylesterase